MPVTYERHTVKTITGIVYAHAYFYDFFERLSKSCNDSKSEITKLEDLTNRYIEKGWDIDFIPPINIQNGKVEELDKDYIKIKNILKGSYYGSKEYINK